MEEFDLLCDLQPLVLRME